MLVIVARMNPIVAMIFLVLSAVSTSWCAADCAAQALTPSSCHHEETLKACDDPTTVIPDGALPAPHFAFEPLFTIVVPPAPLRIASPVGLFPPSPPLRL